MLTNNIATKYSDPSSGDKAGYLEDTTKVLGLISPILINFDLQLGHLILRKYNAAFSGAGALATVSAGRPG
ncbi:MAG: hypothetical protein KUF74_10925 [Candidatus Thiodiazotropha sp. (ex Ctena orbiculata)]|nr:hypothetical protein [Candidatus Thiodiazotropha taylori]